MLTWQASPQKARRTRAAWKLWHGCLCVLPRPPSPAGSRCGPRPAEPAAAPELLAGRAHIAHHRSPQSTDQRSTWAVAGHGTKLTYTKRRSWPSGSFQECTDLADSQIAAHRRAIDFRCLDTGTPISSCGGAGVGRLPGLLRSDETSPPIENSVSGRSGKESASTNCSIGE